MERGESFKYLNFVLHATKKMSVGTSFLVVAASRAMFAFINSQLPDACWAQHKAERWPSSTTLDRERERVSQACSDFEGHCGSVGGEIPCVGVHPQQVCHGSETTPHTHGVQQIHPPCCNQLLLRRHSMLQLHSILTADSSTAVRLFPNLTAISAAAPLGPAVTAAHCSSAAAITSLC